MKAFVTKPAPGFTAQAVVKGQIKEIKLSDYCGKYVVLFFYPLDFTFVCPTELVAFSDQMAEFTNRDCVLLAVSVDSHFSHLAWTNMPRKAGGLGDIQYPIIADLNKAISRDYGVLIEEEGIALRGLFLIDKAGVIRHSLVNDLPIGRSVTEAVRTLDALQHFETNGEVCPADWSKGKMAMKPDVEGSKTYFEAAHK